MDVDENPYHVISDDLPKMLSSEAELILLESIGGSSRTAITVMIIMPIVLGVGLKGILSKLWAMLNTIQLIHALSMIQVSVPSNVLTVQKESYAIINFQPIDKDLVYTIIFGEEEEFPDSEETPSTRRMLQDEEDST